MTVSSALPRTFDEALATAKGILGSSIFLLERGGVESEAEQLVIGAYRKSMGRGRTFSRDDLYVRALHRFPPDAGENLVAWAKARAHGQLLQHLLGYQYFLNHEYLVSKAVLVPRPETEILVFEAMAFLKRNYAKVEWGGEIGLGCGIISIELIKLFSDLKMIATETSPDAIQLAEKNAEIILSAAGRRERLQILTVPASEVMEPLIQWQKAGGAVLDFLIANPPYLRDRTEVDDEVFQSEPHGALFAPASDVLFFYRRIAKDASAVLKPGGHLFLELPHERATEIQKLFAAEFQTQILPDLSGRARVLHAQWKYRN